MLHWTPFSIVLFFIFFMVVEIMLLVAVASEIGGFAIILEIFLSAVLGVYFIKHNALGRLNVAEDAETRKPLLPLMQEVIAFLIAGLLLILPGLITDFIGLLLAIPHLRWRFMDYFEQKGGMSYTKNSDTLNKMFNMEGWENYRADTYGDSGHNNNTNPSENPSVQQTTVIEGEYYEIEKDKGDKNDR